MTEKEKYKEIMNWLQFLIFSIIGNTVIYQLSVIKDLLTKLTLM